MTSRPSSTARSILTLSHLYPSSAYPGWGPFVRDEVVELARRNRVSVVAPIHRRWPTSPLGRRVAAVPYEAVENGVMVVRPRLPGIPVGGRLVEPWLWARRLHPLLLRVYDEIGGDLAHAHFALPDGFAAAYFARRAGAPLVMTVWGSDVLVRGRDSISRALLRQTLRRTDAVVAVSEELAERARDLGASASRVSVIPGGVPYLERVQKTVAREYLGLPSEGACLLWVGGFLPVKQPLDVVWAFERLRMDYEPAATLVMVGEGPLLPSVRRYVQQRGLTARVRLTGRLPREEVWRWHCAADVLLNTSRSEGTPLAVLEALGAGARVAAYPLPGVRAAVEAVAGGVLAVAATPDALARAAAEALAAAGHREVLAGAARERFAIEKTVRLLEEVYEAVL